MLTAKQNMREVIRGGKPDRFVNQYEAVQLMMPPYWMFTPAMAPLGGGEVKNAWGVTNVWPEGTPGQFPVHTPEKLLIKDIENWRDYVKGPSHEYSEEQWGIAQDAWNAVDGNLAYKAVFAAPGLFEQTHHFCSIIEALCYYVEYEDEMHDLIKYLTEWELKEAEQICSRLHPDAVFHHDDWGTEINSFFSPDMFAEFFVEPYKQIYGYYKDHGCEIVIHHSDSYAANLVPSMIEMGIDVWQGCMEKNDVPALVQKYGDRITFMGNIDNKSVDFAGWTPEDCAAVTARALEGMPMTHFIPCIVQGGPGSTVPGAYLGLANAIDQWNIQKFGFTQEELDAQRILPWTVMF